MVALHRVLGEPQLLDAAHGVISPQPGEGDIALIIAPWGTAQTLCDCCGQGEPSCASYREQNPDPSPADWAEPPELCLTTGGHWVSFPQMQTAAHTSGNDTQLLRAYCSCLHGVFVFSKIIHCRHTQLDWIHWDISTGVVYLQTQSLSSV